MHTRFTIEVDGRPFEVHERSVTGRQIKELAKRHEGAVYRVDGHVHHRIEDSDTVHVHDGERFILVHALHHRHHDGEEREQQHPVFIEIDGKRFEAVKREMTGPEIKSLAHKPSANTLYLIEKRDGRPFRREVGDTETLHLHSGECFVTQPPVGKTS